jgi:hypothetical protein
LHRPNQVGFSRLGFFTPHAGTTAIGLLWQYEVVGQGRKAMKKLGLVFAAATALVTTLIFLASAQAQAPAPQGKRLWQGFVEELRKIGAPAPAPAPAKAAPAKPAPKKAAPKKAEPAKAAPAKAEPAKAAPAKAPAEKK